MKPVSADIRNTQEMTMVVVAGSSRVTSAACDMTARARQWLEDMGFKAEGCGGCFLGV